MIDGASTQAVIDIGTNSVKLLVARVTGAGIVRLHEGSEQTRLGEGFYETRMLSPGAIIKTAEAVRDAVQRAEAFRADSLSVIATSAAREAANQDALVAMVRSMTGLEVRVISGEQEAAWVFQGVSSHPGLADRNLLVVDVGGGSSEFVIGHNEEMLAAHSFPLGTVRMLEMFPPADPPQTSDLQRLSDHLTGLFQSAILSRLGPQSPCPAPDNSWLVGTGGTSAILARIHLGMDEFVPEKIESTILTLSEIQTILRRLWGLTLAERRLVRGLPAARADVILMGAAIFESIMRQLGFSELRVSTRGLRFAAARHAAQTFTETIRLPRDAKHEGKPEKRLHPH